MFPAQMSDSLLLAGSGTGNRLAFCQGVHGCGAKWDRQDILRSSLVCLQARSVRCEPDEVDEQKARRRIRRYVENFLRVQRSLAMRIALRSVKILMNSLVNLKEKK